MVLRRRAWQGPIAIRLACQEVFCVMLECIVLRLHSQPPVVRAMRVSIALLVHRLPLSRCVRKERSVPPAALRQCHVRRAHSALQKDCPQLAMRYFAAHRNSVHQEVRHRVHLASQATLVQTAVCRRAPWVSFVRGELVSPLHAPVVAFARLHN